MSAVPLSSWGAASVPAIHCEWIADKASAALNRPVATSVSRLARYWEFGFGAVDKGRALAGSKGRGKDRRLASEPKF